MPDEGRIVDEGEMKRVGKQIKLPWSKAVEIAVKSLKIRFGRSLVTTASIVLAIAFLMSILTGTTLITSLKTEPVRRVIEFREQHEAAARGEPVDRPFPAHLTIDSAREKINSLQAELKKKNVPALDRRLLQADLQAAQAAAKVLEKTGPAAEAEWRKLQTKAAVVRAENEWQLLARKLAAEGYADVKPEITTRVKPERLSFVGMLLRQMDPRDKWLALLAALVCFVGIWNAMLMSVHERFREIGTMKCLGALESFIIKLYFLESSFIGMVGTMLGIVIGFLLSMVRAVSAFGFTTVFKNFSLADVLLSALGTLIVGSLLSIGAAIFPARSAAKMDPVEAMRVDE